jgi:membrane-bound lytic murein transglycosylase D
LNILFRIFIIYLFLINAQATLVSTSFISSDLKVLEELDISSEYITDYDLQRQFQRTLRHTQDRYTKKLNDAYLFVPKIKKVLRENGIPSAFLYLVMAESNFILDAKSHKSAKGMWQFMRGTANVYGLKTNEYIDERMDIVKSTKAAVTYLKKLHKMFDKWYLAAIAYNCGQGRVIEGLTRATIDMYCEDVGYKVCRKDPKINEYRRIIHGYQHKWVKFRELSRVYRKVKKWDYKPDIDKLLVVQKSIKRQYIPDESRGYIRKIISLAMMNNSDFLIKDDNTHLLNRGISDPIASIQVKGGILLRNVAEVVGISKEQLKKLNRHIRREILPMDQEYYTLYIPYSKLSRYNANKENLKATRYALYKVQRGDTLGTIGRKFRIDYKIIKRHNKLRSNIISINQELAIPVVDPSAYVKPVEYIVQVGDTLHKIASKYNITFKQIMKDNKLKTSMIKTGDKLVIKYQ